jgi:cell division protein FtsW (lipid II flippase)
MVRLRRALTRERWLLLIAAAFVVSSMIAYSLAVSRRLSWQHLAPILLWLSLVVIVHLALERFLPGRDPYLLPIVALLLGWGLVAIDRLAPVFLWRQVMWQFLGLGTALAICVWRPDLRLLRRYRYSWLTLGLLLLLATFVFGVNPSGAGATLWLPVPVVGAVYFQPSELLKLLLVVFLASYFAERQAMLEGGGRRSLPYLAPLILMWGFCVLLLVWQRDLGAATLFFVVFLALLYIATGEHRYLMLGAALLLIAGIIGYFAFDVVALRVDAWWNPWPDASDRAFQIVQSLYALGAGGILGQGVGQGCPGYVPVVHTDFVFAALTEEWGLVGGMTLVALFLLLALRGMRVALYAERPFSLYLSAGISLLFAAQALLIMSGVVKLLPLTGVTLPFVSYGGSSMLVSCLMIGLLLYLSDEVPEPRPLPE